MHKFVVASAPAVLPYQPPKWMAEHRQWVFDLVQSDTFENCVIWAVLMDVCFMGLEFVGEPQIWTDTLFAVGPHKRVTAGMVVGFVVCAIAFSSRFPQVLTQLSRRT